MLPEMQFSAASLHALGFTDDLVDRIMRFLNTSATDLSGSKPESVVSVAFGTSPAGADCATQANKARQYVVAAINEMVTGLHHYHSSIEGMRRQAHAADDTAVQDIHNIQRYIVAGESCASTPTVSTPNVCAPSTEEASS